MRHDHHFHGNFTRGFGLTFGGCLAVLAVIVVVIGIGILVLRERRTPEPDLKPARTGDPNKVAIQPIDFDGLEREVKSHRGSVVLVDFWAT